MSGDPRPAEWRRARLASVRLYLVTDDTTPLEALPRLVELVTAVGVDAVQLRRKGATWADLVDVAVACRDAAHRSGALFIVNDHARLAVAADADGLHIGQEDEPIASVHALVGADRLVGVSTHEVGEAVAAALAGADYLGVGPIHATPTKPGAPARGVGLVAKVRARVAIPLVAIGGIDRTNAAAPLVAGADAVAVVRAISAAPDPVAATRALRAAVDAARAGWGRPAPATAPA